MPLMHAVLDGDDDLLVLLTTAETDLFISGLMGSFATKTVGGSIWELVGV